MQELANFGRRITKARINQIVRSLPAGDYLWRAYELGMGVMAEALGLEWVERHILSANGRRHYLRQKLAQLSVDELQNAHMYLVINLDTYKNLLIEA